MNVGFARWYDLVALQDEQMSGGEVYYCSRKGIDLIVKINGFMQVIVMVH